MEYTQTLIKNLAKMRWLDHAGFVEGVNETTQEIIQELLSDYQRQLDTEHKYYLIRCDGNFSTIVDPYVDGKSVREYILSPDTHTVTTSALLTLIDTKNQVIGSKSVHVVKTIDAPVDCYISTVAYHKAVNEMLLSGNHLIKKLHDAKVNMARDTDGVCYDVAFYEHADTNDIIELRLINSTLNKEPIVYGTVDMQLSHTSGGYIEIGGSTYKFFNANPLQL